MVSNGFNPWCCGPNRNWLQSPRINRPSLAAVIGVAPETPSGNNSIVSARDESMFTNRADNRNLPRVICYFVQLIVAAEDVAFIGSIHLLSLAVSRIVANLRWGTPVI